MSLKCYFEWQLGAIKERFNYTYAINHGRFGKIIDDLLTILLGLADLVGQFGVTKFGKSDQKLIRISGFPKHSKTQSLATTGGEGRI